MPEEQAAVPRETEHAVAQLPQRFTSVLRFTLHPVAMAVFGPQKANGALQEAMMQLPLEQVVAPLGVAPQTFPQAPQFEVSVRALTQTPLQLVSPALHTQTPLEQVELVWQTLPAVPQLLLSVSRLTSHPLA